MKFSKYNMVVETNYGLIIYNSRQSNFVQIHKEEEISKFLRLQESIQLDKDDEMVKAFYQRGFIVDDEVNEYEEVKKDIQKILNKEKTLYIMLYVTENCNFRCVYCPELHTNKRFSEENWEALYKYIEKGFKLQKYDTLRMAFYGGEPLLESKAILEFLDKLEVLKKEFPAIKLLHNMTTNGYLLNPEIYDKLVEKNVLFFQITVDGFAKSHNQTRPLAGGGESWDRIIENLKYINNKEDNAKIVLRSNISQVSIDTMDKFTNWAGKTFDNPKISFMFGPVTKFSVHVNDQYVQDDYDPQIIEIANKAIKNRDKKEVGTLKKLGCACRFAYESFFSLSVDGEIRKCENNCNGEYPPLGYLSKEGEFVFSVDMSKWNEGWETEYCKDCVAYPLCGGRRCPDKKFMYPDERPDCVWKTSDPPSDAEMKFIIANILTNNYCKVENGNDND